MRLNTSVLFLLPCALLLAESEAGKPPTVEIRTVNGAVSVAGTDSGEVRVSDPSRAAIRNENGRVIVTGDAVNGGAIRIEVPCHAALDLVTSNGAVRVSGVTGPMTLTTSNGAIVVEDAGTSEIHAHTSNGSIEIGVALRAGASISARTSNGRIHSDMEVVRQHFGESFLEGKIGGGGPLLELRTSNGPIRIRHSGDVEQVTSRFTPGEVK
jgi:DUF4097 and DUF4098 domain-containing protein YvlB